MRRTMVCRVLWLFLLVNAVVPKFPGPFSPFNTRAPLKLNSKKHKSYVLSTNHIKPSSPVPSTSRALPQVENVSASKLLFVSGSIKHWIQSHIVPLFQRYEIDSQLKFWSAVSSNVIVFQNPTPQEKNKPEDNKGPPFICQLWFGIRFSNPKGTYIMYDTRALSYLFMCMLMLSIRIASHRIASAPLSTSAPSIIFNSRSWETSSPIHQKIWSCPWAPTYASGSCLWQAPRTRSMPKRGSDWSSRSPPTTPSPPPPCTSCTPSPSTSTCTPMEISASTC